MKIITVRRISQGFFFVLFAWCCIVMSVGDQWWQLRGWPVNWFIHLDPLAGISTLLTTGTLYHDMWWSFITIALTLVLGRFFCGFVCPFGSIHHFIGYFSHRKKPLNRKVQLNAYSKWQTVKYYLLIVFLMASLMGALEPLLGKSVMIQGALQIGLLDPMPLIYRSFQLVLLPMFSSNAAESIGLNRFFHGAWLIGLIFFTLAGLNILRPRFFCRYLCPLGALLGLLNQFALWRIGKTRTQCTDCMICERNCEGACHPAGILRFSECLLCMNCRNDCHHGLIGFNPHRSVSGEISLPQISRRHFLGAAFAGALYIPVLRLDGSLANNWNSGLVRPPGAMPEPDFLSRCLKCGQCMRICPTNVIQPALFEGGLEGIWTPVLNFRTGTSGCQLNCIACGNVCPTAAIRPISIEEKRGEGDFLENGPIRIGMAFVDHGRCLPWSMDLPCIVCQENCPVSPKAIFTRTVFQDLRGLEILKIASVSPDTVTLQQKFLPLARYATGDYYCRAHNFESPRKILSHSGDSLTLSTDSAWKVMPEVGDSVAIAVKLQHPYVDPSRCIGCGVCEHECPVKGLRAIRVTGENETRNREHQLLLRRPEA